MTGHSPEPFCEDLCIAVFASGADFRAAAQRVPSGVRPFDFGVIAHNGSRTAFSSSHAISQPARTGFLEASRPSLSRIDFNRCSCIWSSSFVIVEIPRAGISRPILSLRLPCLIFENLSLAIAVLTLGTGHRSGSGTPGPAVGSRWRSCGWLRGAY